MPIDSEVIDAEYTVIDAEYTVITPEQQKSIFKIDQEFLSI